MIYFLIAILIALVITIILFKKQVYSIVPTTSFLILIQIIMLWINYLYEYHGITQLRIIYDLNSFVLFVFFPLFNVFVLYTYTFAVLKGEIWTLSHKISLAFSVIIFILVLVKTGLLIINLFNSFSNIIDVLLYCSNFMSTMTLSYILATQRYRFYRNNLTENRYDCIVVLGYRLDGVKVSDILMQRIEMAYGYFVRHGSNIPIFLSGGKCYANEISEADAMEMEFLRLGVSKKLIHKECNASNTNENFKYIANTLINSGVKNPRILVVTNYFHMLRAISIAKTVGMNADAIGSKKNIVDKMHIKLMSREIMAFIFTKPYLILIYIETVLLMVSIAYIAIK